MRLFTFAFSILISLSFALQADSDMDRLVYLKGTEMSAIDVLSEAERQLGYRLNLTAPDRMEYRKDYDDFVSLGQIFQALKQYFEVHNGISLDIRNLGRGRYLISSGQNVVVDVQPEAESGLVDLEKMNPTVPLADLDSMHTGSLVSIEHSSQSQSAVKVHLLTDHKPESSELLDSSSAGSSTEDPVLPNDANQLNVEVLGRQISLPNLDQRTITASSSSLFPDLNSDHIDVLGAKRLSLRERASRLSLSSLSKPMWRESIPCSPLLSGFMHLPNLFDSQRNLGWGLSSSLWSQQASTGADAVKVRSLNSGIFYRWNFGEWTFEEHLSSVALAGDVRIGSKAWSNEWVLNALNSSVEREWLLMLDGARVKVAYTLKVPLDSGGTIASSGSIDHGLFAAFEQKSKYGELEAQVGLLSFGNHKSLGKTKPLVVAGSLTFGQNIFCFDRSVQLRTGLHWMESPIEPQGLDWLDGDILMFDISLHDRSERLPFGVRLYVGASEASADWGVALDW